MIRCLPLLLTFLVGILPEAGFSQNLQAYTVGDGLCTQTMRDQLNSKKVGSSYTLESADIFTSRGLRPRKTGRSIRPLVKVQCHEIQGNKVLISTPSPGNFCGWVETDRLLTGIATKSLDGTERSNICGKIIPLSIKEFCARSEKLDARRSGCLKGIGSDSKAIITESPFETKIMIWNANLDGEKQKERTLIPVFARPGDQNKKSDVGVFTVLRVFDVVKVGNEVYYLVGSNFRKMEGWIKQDSGAIWFSKLAVYFSTTGTEEVTSEPPGVVGSVTLANAPEDVEAQLYSIDPRYAKQRPFMRYPVLEDARIGINDNHIPHLRIAFLGSFCDASANCDPLSGLGSITGDVDTNAGDILFVVDGTRSMQAYYPIIARAIDNLAGNYVGAVGYRFGLNMYGDFLSKNQLAISDKMQIRPLVKMRPLLTGTEFEKAINAEMYIKDHAGGYSEAVNAALFKSIQAADWNPKTPNFVVHIGDHGDRGFAPLPLLAELKKNNIFYLPVAVRGSNFQAKENTDFFKQAQSILDRHKTPSGVTIGLPKALIAYDLNGNSKSNPELEYEAIASALASSLELGSAISDEIVCALTNCKLSDLADGERRLPAGHANMTQAAMDLFGIDIDAVKDDVVNFQVAAGGAIEVAKPGTPENNWTYYAAVKPSELNTLASSFTKLCVGLLDANGQDIFRENIGHVIEILTGDKLSNSSEFLAYFSDRANIPLSNQTMLGEGIIQMFDAMKDVFSGKAEKYQQEVCRSSALLNMVIDNKIVRHPYPSYRNSKNGEMLAGDMEWNIEQKRFLVKNNAQSKHQWELVDIYGERIVFIPLIYFPQPPSLILSEVH